MLKRWVHEKHGGVRGGLGQGGEYAEREGRMGGGRGAWVVGVGAEKPPAWA